jgi:nitrous oxidase accessory protein NosD
MRVPSTRRLGALAAAALASIALGGLAAAVASAWRGPTRPKPPTLFVNGSILSGYAHDSCSAAPYTTIGAAVTAAEPRSDIVVCPGTYKEDVTVTKPLSIEGIHATVDATGYDNGFTLPAPAAGTRIEGFTVENAVGEGILLVTTSKVSIVDNTIENNDKGVRQAHTYEECEVTPQNPFPDCGEALHLMGTSNSHIVGNTVRDNAGGVLMTDETGPTDGNVVAHNQVLDNTADCGITLAGHNPAAAPGGTPNPSAAGVYNNLIEDNASVGNGVAGEGAGVLLAADIPTGGGAVYDNTVRGNFLEGNGLAGVTLHNHVPDQDLNGNRIVGNRIATNNLDGDKDFPVPDPSTTGVFVGTAGATLTITIKHNVIYSNTYGIFLTGPLNTEQISANRFFGVTTDIVGP